MGSVMLEVGIGNERGGSMSEAVVMPFNVIEGDWE